MTEYYRLKKPFTSIRAVVGGGHTELSLWVNCAKTGIITLRNEEVKDVILALARVKCAVSCTGIGAGKMQLNYEDDDVELETQLINEYGELTTLAEVEKLCS